MVDCAEFLDDYSDFRDGLLAAERRAAFERHVGACASCAAYHRVVTRGVEEFGRLPEIAPSQDFSLRLQDRLLEEEWLHRRASSAAPMGVTVAVAAALGLAAWLPTLRQRQPMEVLPAVLAQRPAPAAPAPAAEMARSALPLPRYVPIHAGLLQPALYTGPAAGALLAAYPLPLSAAPGH